MCSCGISTLEKEGVFLVTPLFSIVVTPEFLTF
jgi:hypothetical protein